MDVNVGWGPVLGSFEHCGPKQGVEIYNVFTDEVVYLAVRIRSPVIIEVKVMRLAILSKGRHITNGSIDPNVEIFSRLIGDFKSKIGSVSRNVPVLKPLIKPLRQFVGDRWVECPAVRPLF